VLDWVDGGALKWRLAPWHSVFEGDGERSSGRRHLDTLRKGSSLRRAPGSPEVLAQLLLADTQFREIPGSGSSMTALAPIAQLVRRAEATTDATRLRLMVSPSADHQRLAQPLRRYGRRSRVCPPRGADGNAIAPAVRASASFRRRRRQA
jgi:hypothetical protein